MAILTQTQVLAYNKKVTEAKEKASQDKARKELAEKELIRTCGELSDLLGKKITPENLESEYEAFMSEAQKTMESGVKILEGLESEQTEALASGATNTIPEEPVHTQVETTATEVTDSGIDLDDLLGL